MSTPVYYGTMKGGKLKADAFMEHLRSIDGPVRLTVARDNGRRSNQANRYYWGVCVELIHRALKEGGIETSREGTHELLKFRFLKEDHPIGKDGEFSTTITSTADLPPDEFVAYLERCIQFAAEYLNVIIPQPGEQQEMEYENAA